MWKRSGEIAETVPQRLTTSCTRPGMLAGWYGSVSSSLTGRLLCDTDDDDDDDDDDDVDDVVAFVPRPLAKDGKKLATKLTPRGLLLPPLARGAATVVSAPSVISVATVLELSDGGIPPSSDHLDGAGTPSVTDIRASARFNVVMLLDFRNGRGGCVSATAAAAAAEAAAAAAAAAMSFPLSSRTLNELDRRFRSRLTLAFWCMRRLNVYSPPQLTDAIGRSKGILCTEHHDHNWRLLEPTMPLVVTPASGVAGKPAQWSAASVSSRRSIISDASA